MSDGSTTAVKCYRAGREDVPALARICEEIFPSMWTEISLHLELQSEVAHIWLARSGRDGSGSSPKGFVVVRRVLDELHVYSLGVREPCRRGGVGVALMNQALAWARAEGLQVAFLEQRGSNAASRALYESLGFVVVGRRPRYYRDGEDALLMNLVLAGARRNVDSTPGDD